MDNPNDYTNCTKCKAIIPKVGERLCDKCFKCKDCSRVTTMEGELAEARAAAQVDAVTINAALEAHGKADDEAARLRAALEMVEYVDVGYPKWEMCLWCGCERPPEGSDEDGHADDCARQLAIQGGG